MVLHGGRATVNGRRSETGLYDFNLATYESGDTFDQSSSRGFIEIYGMQSKLAAPATCVPATVGDSDSELRQSPTSSAALG